MNASRGVEEPPATTPLPPSPLLSDQACSALPTRESSQRSAVSFQRETKGQRHSPLPAQATDHTANEGHTKKSSQPSAFSDPVSLRSRDGGSASRSKALAACWLQSPGMRSLSLPIVKQLSVDLYRHVAVVEHLEQHADTRAARQPHVEDPFIAFE